jgi:hypothetical protein
LFTKNSSWQAKQSISQTERLCENVQRLRPELWRRKNWLLHHNSALFHISFFTAEFLTINNMTPFPLLTLLVLLGILRLFPPFWQNRSDRGRIAGEAEHPHRTWPPACI